MGGKNGCACIGKTIARQFTQAQCIIEFAIGEHAGIRGDDGTAKVVHHAAVEIQLEKTRSRFTHRVRQFDLNGANHCILAVSPRGPSQKSADCTGRGDAHWPPYIMRDTIGGRALAAMHEPVHRGTPDDNDAALVRGDAMKTTSTPSMWLAPAGASSRLCHQSFIFRYRQSRWGAAPRACAGMVLGQSK